MSDMTFGEWLLVFLKDHPEIEIQLTYFNYLAGVRIRMISYDYSSAKKVNDYLCSRNKYDSTLFDDILIETVKHMYEQLIHSEEDNGTGD